MKILTFILAIINLIYIPIQICLPSGGCGSRRYDFIFSIPSSYSIDFGRLGLQLLILAIIFGATYTDLYKKFALEWDKEDELKAELGIALVLGVLIIGLGVIIWIINKIYWFF